MASVTELSAPFANVMLGPRPGPGVCAICFDLTPNTTRCTHCDPTDPCLDAVAPISYSIAHEQLHHVLAAYKRAPEAVASMFQAELAAVLWRYLADHEACLAAAAHTPRFELITTVPSTSRATPSTHPLTRIVSELVAPTRERYAELLAPAPERRPPHTEDPHRFTPTTRVTGASVLLIDDTWTTGANARSAATALTGAGARTVAAVVIGRHLHRDYAGNDRRLRALPRTFDWTTCPHHRPTP